MNANEYHPPMGPFPYLPFANVAREGVDAVVRPWGYKKYGGCEHGTETRIPNVFSLTPGKDLGRDVVWVGFADYRGTVAEVLRLTGHSHLTDSTRYALCGTGNGYRLDLASGIALWQT